MASFLYYMGLLTLTGRPRPPADPQPGGAQALPRPAARDLPARPRRQLRGAQDRHALLPRRRPLAAARLLRGEAPAGALQPRPRRGAQPARARRQRRQRDGGQSLFLSILFDDRYYQVFSEPELEKSTPTSACWSARRCAATASSICSSSSSWCAARAGEARAASCAAWTTRRCASCRRWRRRSPRRGSRSSAIARRSCGVTGPALNLRSYAVVAVGLERILGEEIEPGPLPPAGGQSPQASRWLRSKSSTCWRTLRDRDRRGGSAPGAR